MSVKTGVVEPELGETRLCPEPWLHPAIRADGGVMRCCFGGLDFGIVGAESSFSQILNSDSARLSREQLLSGRLDEVCRMCPRFPIVKLEEYRSYIESMRRHAGALSGALTDAVVPISVWLEMTSQCNLRCVYCHQAGANWISDDLPPAAIDAVIQELILLGVKRVSLTGRGENTFMPGWEKYAERLLDAGVSVVIITNLARPITDHEARIFARMSNVGVSIDTVDRAVFKRVRTSDVRIVLENVVKIMATVRKQPNPDFRMGWTAVVSADVAPGFLDLAATAVALGVSRVEFQCLIGLGGEQNNRLATIDEMPIDVAVGVARAVRDAEQFLINKLGPDGVFVAAGLRTFIDKSMGAQPQEQSQSIWEVLAKDE
jgi:MoaA/NifB/PqqE/SkfB family radical SAM enzyme